MNLNPGIPYSTNQEKYFHINKIPRLSNKIPHLNIKPGGMTKSVQNPFASHPSIVYSGMLLLSPLFSN